MIMTAPLIRFMFVKQLCMFRSDVGYLFRNESTAL
jgi:hypothetical protein